ncbi:MAG: trigger factor [Gammaproteobacteria bacterium]|nr:trigger factor [Gammaproteobacteria bacterium]
MSESRVLDEQIDGLTYRFRIALDSREMTRAVDTQLKTLGRTARLPGFRPGRAPLPILRNRFGRQVREAVADRMAMDVARRIIVERQLQPARRPALHMDAAADPGEPTFTLLLEVAPTVDLGELPAFELRRLQPSHPDPELEAHADSLLRRELFDALTERYDFPVPADMVENEYARIVAGFEAQVGERIDPTLADRLRAIAERRIRLAIIFTEIGAAYDIHVPRDEVEALVEQQAERDPEHQAAIIDYYLDHPTAMAELQSPLFEDRVVAFLLERSRIEDVNVSTEELLAAVEQA